MKKKKSIFDMVIHIYMVSDRQRAHLFISGRVQGVFFRSSAKQKASRLLLTGWIKNLADGKIESIIEGERGNIEEFIQWCKTGPSSAEVNRIDVEWKTATQEFDEFEVRYM